MSQITREDGSKIIRLAASDGFMDKVLKAQKEIESMTKSKEKLSKRERIERGEYTKHSNAQPYVREQKNTKNIIDKLDDDDKLDIANTLLGDWDAL